MRIFNARGRSRRTEYLFDQITFTLAVSLVISVTLYISKSLTSPFDEIFGVFSVLLIFIPYFAVNIISSIKRLHDLNSSGSQIFFMLVPFYNLVFWFRLLLEKGTNGINKYGPDPRIDPERKYRKQVIKNLLEITVLMILLFAVHQIEQNRNLREKKAFIEHPKANHYLILESDDDPEYKYFLIKITHVTTDSCVVYYSNYSYGYTYDAINSIPSDDSDFLNNYSYWGTFSKDFLNEINIIEVIDK